MNPNKNPQLQAKLQKALSDISKLAKMIAEPGRSPSDVALVSDLLRKRTAAANALLKAQSPEVSSAPANAELDGALPKAPVGDIALDQPDKQMVADNCQIEETTAMASGAVQGTAKGDNFKDSLDMRNTNESKFRKYIKTLLEELYIQDKKLLFELAENPMDFMPAQNGGDNLMTMPQEQPQQNQSAGSTGIEHLDELFNNIRPIIEKSYLRLKSSKEQRVSYAIHLKKAIEDQLNMLEMNVTAETAATSTANVASNSGPTQININQKLNSPELPAKDDEEARIRNFSVPGLNETGRNFALKTFDDIDEQIEKAFRLIGKEDKEDRNNFKTYLLKNIVLLFEQLEDGLGNPAQAGGQQNIV